ncbi:MAG: erythromycin esterase family protein [Polyangiaceae bacterium]
MAIASEIPALRIAATPLVGAASDFDGLLERIGGRRIVLLGEASHGTHEFYRTRAEITKRLIEEKGFHAVAIEGDWPDAHRVHEFVAGTSSDRDAVDALAGFQRFPTWMWRNADVVDFVDWLRAFNADRDPERRVGFFGMDLYSLHASMAAVLAHLDARDPEAAARARERYACFDHYGEDTQLYGLRAGLSLDPSCEQELTNQLVEMQSRLRRALESPGPDAPHVFSAMHNARVARNAEEYYRNMLGGRVSTWNLRDQHMVDTLESLDEWIGRRGGPAKIVVWAHNSHLGDARATDMAKSGEWNVGQLIREKHGRDAFLVGFTTYEGTVTAARDWDEPAEQRRVRPALAGSWEALFHEVETAPFVLFTDPGASPAALRAARLSRAIGVIYRPETERQSHYFKSRIGEQFDAILHFDRTSAVQPLERTSQWVTGELPETYPFAV